MVKYFVVIVYIEFNNEEVVILMAKSESRICVREEVWYLDSGCNNHMVETKAWLFYFDGNLI